MSRILLRLPQVRARCGNKSRAQIWRDVRNGTFPAPVEIGPNSKAWFDDEIDEWQENLSRANYAPTDDAAKNACDQPTDDGAEAREADVG